MTLLAVHRDLAANLRDQAADAMNNGTLLSVTVTVTASASTMRCSSLTLGGTTFGSRASPRARATLTDPVGRAVRGAQVSGSWTRPDGSAVAATATTDSRGQATFSTSGPRGTWTFTVAGSTRAGYRFDAASSVTRASRVY